MAGKMNWSRVGKETTIQRYGSEKLAARDSSLPRETQADREAIAAKKQRHISPKISREEQAARALKNADARKRNKIKAAEAHLKKEQESLEKLAKIELLKKQKAEEKERQVRLSAEFEAKLKQMTAEERVAFEQSQFTRVYRKRKPVIVEHAPLKPKAGRGQGKGGNKAQRKGGGIP